MTHRHETPPHDPALDAVWDALPEARMVGGAVRDRLIGRPVADIDLATPRDPESVVRTLAEHGLRAVPTGLKHGTVTAISGGRGFEVTTLRRDVATDGRRATVAFTDDWIEDAARRDFTFNAMSMDRAGTLFDPFGGAADLAAGVVRFVGDPALRIAEDFLRVLRYFRFLARYGSGPPDPATLAALAAGVPGLAQLSAERVRSELKRILSAPDPGSALRLMRDLGVLGAVLPEAGGLERLERLVAAGAPPAPLLRFAALIQADLVANLAVRLRLSGEETERLAHLLQADPILAEGADDDALRRALAVMDRATLIDRLWLAQAPAALRQRVEAMPRPVFPLQGRDLLKLGLTPGPELGRRLRELQEWWAEGGCLATREALLAELARRRAA